MDIADTPGTHTWAPTAMRVLETGWNIGPGRTGVGVLGELMNGMYTYFGHNSPGGVVVKPGDLLAPGQRVGDQGTTGNVTGAHLHWELHQGRAWNDINPHPYWDAAGGGGVMPGGPNDRWTGTIMQALRLAGLPTTGPYVSAWQRQIQTESGGNPRAVQRVHDINSIMGNHARGLVQVIPPTFAAYAMPGMRDIFNPLHNLTAGMRYARSRYGITGMLSAIGQGRGYEHGTDHALPGWAWVGESGPELVKFRGGERVMTNSESRAAVAGMEFDYDRMGRAIAKHLPAMGQVNINNPNVRDTDELARTTAREFRKETKRLARI
jgi:SLT domain-containing protein